MIHNFLKDIKKEFLGYNKAHLKNDLLSGLTVTAVALPLALAFGVSCGATAAAGLITAIIAGLVIGTLSGASYQISGPTGAMTAILIMLFAKYGISGVWVAGVISGIVLVVAGLLKLGRIVSYIPAPVVTGFTSGIALIIAIGQIDNLLGIQSENAESSAVKLLGYFLNGVSPNWHAVLLGAIVIATMILWPKKWNSFLPSSLVGLILSLCINMFLKLPVSVIGEIPKTLLPAERLNIFAINPHELQGMLFPALSIAALGMIESLLCAEVGGKMKGEKFDANRELVSQGIGNIIIPFFGGVPATAAIARTSVGIKAGGRTRLVSIFHSLGLIISMFLLSPVMSQIPLASLAGVLIVTAWRMNEWESIRYIFSKRFKSAISKFVITMLATVIFDLTQAIIIGVVFASLIFMAKISTMQIKIEAVDKSKLSDKYRPLVQGSLDHIRVVYFIGPLFFATVQQLHGELSDFKSNSVLILSMRGVPLIDTSGLKALEQLHAELRANGSKLMLCGLQPQVQNMLERSELTKVIGKDMIFWSADQAIIAAQ